MIVPHLKGGLGNQLFQIAASYAHSLDVNDNFGINYNLPHNLGQGNRAIQYKYNVFSKIKSTSIIPSNIYNEPDFSYNKIPFKKDLVLDGYFQSEKYFKDYKDLIKNPDDNLKKEISAIHKVGGKFLVTESKLKSSSKILNEQFNF